MNTSVYIHFPFCVRRCTYCDFNTYAGLDTLISPYVQALCKEIEVLGIQLPQIFQGNVATIYFGGGTPSLISPKELKLILSSLERHFGSGKNIEISLEANPGTLSLQKMRHFLDLGVNRLSIGFQSANDAELKLLGRNHILEEVIQVVKDARLAGFGNLNLDLIYGLPNQTLDAWRNTLNVAISLGVEHLSLYSLTVEEGTLLDEWVKKGALPSPDPDFAADCYEIARDALAKAGYLHYEISNWAKDHQGEDRPFICCHNLQYWKNETYFGLGAGAHGFVSGYRLVNLAHPLMYIQRMFSAEKPAFPLSPDTEESYAVSIDEQMRDTVMLGLRLVEDGVGEEDFLRRFGKPLLDVFPKEIERLLRKGLVEWIETDQRRLRLTRSGQLLGNQAFLEFV